MLDEVILRGTAEPWENDYSDIKRCWLCDLPSEAEICSYCTIKPKPKRQPSELRWPPSEGDLEKLYNDSGMSLHDIARFVGRGYATVHYWFRKYDLVRRNREEASRSIVRKYPVRGFSGRISEKAYMFGIAFGDLHVKKSRKSIEVYTSTSVPSMVDLLIDTFAKYARAKITPTIYYLKGKKIGGWRVRAFLDRSFAFLLEKYSATVPDWVTSSDDTFWSFLAGLFDSEGHSGIYNSERHHGGSTTQLTIVNTNLKLIRWLRSRMEARGFHPIISSERSNTSVWYRLEFGRREELQTLLRILPSRHPKKKVVARLLLKIPTRMDAETSSRIIQEYKLLKQAMKEDDRRQGLSSIFVLEQTFHSKDQKDQG